MFLTHALRAIFRAVVAAVTGDALWKYVTLLLSGTPPAVTFISDASTNNLVVTLNGDTRPSNFNPYTPGYYSNFFDGTGDYLDTPSSTALAFGTGDWEYSFWYNAISASGYLFDTRTGSATGLTFYYDSGAYSVYVNSSVPITGTEKSKNTWHYVTISKVSGSTRLFVDGTQIGSTYTDANNYVSGTIRLGCRFTSITDIPFNGWISNFKVVKGTGVTTQTVPTVPATLTTNTQLLTCQANRLIDNGPNNFAITKAGDTTVSGFIPFVTPTTANVNTLYSTYFDGSGDYLTATLTGQAFGAGNFTAEGWFYITNHVDYNTLMTQRTTGASATGWIVGTNSTGGVYAYSNGFLIGPIGSATLRTWNHVAFVRLSGTMTLYLNGVSLGTSATSKTFSDTAAGVGGDAADAYNLYGYASNVRYVVGTAVYTGAFTPPTSNLMATQSAGTNISAITGTATSLLTCQNSTLIDNSVNAFAITSVGQAQPIAQSPFTQVTTALNTTYLGSGYFDGTGDYLTVPSNAALNFGTGDFTIEAWVYPNSLAGDWFFTASTGTGGLFFGYRQGGAPQGFGWGRTGVAWDYQIASGTVNTWQHVALTRSGTSMRLFVNGTQVGTTQTLATSYDLSLTSTTIGSQGGSYYLNGFISNLRIVKGTAVYTANFAPPVSQLTAVTNTQLLTVQTNQPAANKQFVDNSGNNFPVTQAGNATQGTFSPYGANWSNYFDGSGDYLSVSDNIVFQMGTGDFTLEAWVNPNTLPGSDARIWSYQGAAGTVLNLYLLASGSGSQFAAAIRSHGATGYTQTNGTTVAKVGTWYHVAFSRSSSTTKLFVNGVQEGTTQTSQTQNIQNAAPSIGGYSTGSTEYFSGYISNLRIVKGTAVYTANFTPPTAPLTAITNTSLLTCQDNRLVDNSANAFTITKVGDTTVQRFSPFSPVTQTPQTYSGYFDGSWANVNSGDYLTLSGQANFAFGSNNFTVEMWVYATSFSAAVILYDSRPGSTSGAYGIFYYDTAGIVNWNVNALTITGTAITLNTWNHLAVSRSGTTTKLFINGAQAGTATDTNSYLNGALAPTIGTNGFSRGSNSMQGYISNVRVVNGTAVYTTTFTPSVTPLTAVANTVLLTCQSPTFIDNSANAYAITAVNEPKLSAFNPFGFTNTTGQSYTPALYGGSAYFDGTGDFLSFTGSVATNFYGVNWTIETWVNLNATPANDITGLIHAQSGTNNWIPYIGILVNINRTISCAVGTSVFYTTTQTVPLKTWAHLALVRSGGVVKLYIDGVASSISVTADSPNSNLSFWFGKFDNSPGGGPTLYYYNGYLSNARIVKGTAVYTSNFVPPLAPLTATAGTTLLLNMDKAGVSDSSRSNDLETVGDAKIRDETPYAGSYYSNYFDGDDRLNLSAQTSLTGNFTVEFYFYITGKGLGDPTFISNWPVAATVGNILVIQMSGVSTTVFAVYVGSASGSGNLAFTASTSVYNQWNHIAVTRSGSSMACFLNGVRVSTSTNSNTITLPANTAIGSYTNGDSGGNYFQGYISNLRIVNGTSVYDPSLTTCAVPTTLLTAIANTSLLTCQSKSFVDNSASPLTITKNGDVAVRSQNPFQKNTYSSMYFDGTGDYLFSPSTQFQNYNFGTGDFTIECWLYQTVFSGDRTIIASVSTWATSVNFYFATRAGSPNILLFRAGDSIPITLNGNTGIIASTWTHVAVSRASGVTRMFVEGVLQTTTHTGSVNIGNSVQGTWIGAWGSAVNEPMTGYIADLRITKSARYTATFTPPTAPLLTS